MRWGDEQHMRPHDETSARQMEFVSLFIVLAIAFFWLSAAYLSEELSRSLRLFLSMAISVVVTWFYARRRGKKIAERRAKFERDFRADREAETQKNIDKMLGDNSRIPNVTRGARD